MTNGTVELIARATRAVVEPSVARNLISEWNTEERLLATVQAGGFSKENLQGTLETTAWAPRTEGILDSLSTSFWSPLKDGSEDSMRRWNQALRKRMTIKEKQSGSIEMIAWVCVAKKMTA
ncbi:hypothetical protein BDV26DRAFT_263268 [Aspergillus bertholletiae]|uniref:Uncharacterized protein n=1 Tax=Aspergillus bertholletiae TaxID=1226010 RepID=A0A5N7B630_9EURO|nr:hypothetical protein BDV26DRAFT_263268 [Aspergillus bertholletiae]